jgi:hypothetical protein
MFEKKPLYRKENTRTHHISYRSGSDARHDRNTKNGLSRSMKKEQHGYDYTPLYKFLLSKIGKNFDEVFSEAVARLPKGETKAIYYMFDNTKDYFRSGESSYYSTLIVDENGLIQKTNPELTNEDLSPSCWCCTHTFNGKVLIKKYKV